MFKKKKPKQKRFLTKTIARRLSRIKEMRKRFNGFLIFLCGLFTILLL